MSPIQALSSQVPLEASKGVAASLSIYLYIYLSKHISRTKRKRRRTKMTTTWSSTPWLKSKSPPKAAKMAPKVKKKMAALHPAKGRGLEKALVPKAKERSKIWFVLFWKCKIEVFYLLTLLILLKCEEFWPNCSIGKMSIVIIIKVYDVNLNYELKVNILFSIFLLGKNLNILKET